MLFVLIAKLSFKEFLSFFLQSKKNGEILRFLSRCYLLNPLRHFSSRGAQLVVSLRFGNFRRSLDTFVHVR